MKRYFEMFVALGVACLAARAQDGTAPKAAGPPKTISAAESDKHYDETLTVTGKVVQVNVRPSMAYLNFDKPYPSNLFTAVIFARATNKFASLPKLTGKDVAVTGKVLKFKSKPEMVLDNTNQLTVLEKNK
jgi:DNA/RNA endonuclease YhcR with UshA esterase domain